jgi:hypothetical protein
VPAFGQTILLSTPAPAFWPGEPLGRPNINFTRSRSSSSHAARTPTTSPKRWVGFRYNTDPRNASCAGAHDEVAARACLAIRPLVALGNSLSVCFFVKSKSKIILVLFSLYIHQACQAGSLVALRGQKARQFQITNSPQREMPDKDEVASSSSSSSDDEADDKPRPKRTMRGMLLQYLLYDAFIRPTRFVFFVFTPSNTPKRSQSCRRRRVRVWRR